MDLGLADKVAVVLGATSGLGRATAEALAAEGAHVVVVGRRKELVDELAASLPSAVGVVADVTDPDCPGPHRRGGTRGVRAGRRAGAQRRRPAPRARHPT